MTLKEAPNQVPGTREQIATRVIFCLVGIIMAAWAPLIPLVKARLGLDAAGLGSLLLFGGIGSLLAAPFCGGLLGRFGCRKVILSAGILSCLALPSMIAAENTVTLAIALVFFGASISFMDVSMNVQAVLVEKASEKAMMSGFHGFWSVGGILGAGLVTALLSTGISPLASTLTCIVCVAIGAAFVSKGLVSIGGDRDTPPFVLPKGSVLVIGLLCCVLFMSEGAVLDWGGVLLNLNRGVGEGQAGIGYVAFATTMTIGRLTGDAITSRIGPTRVVLLGSVLAVFGFMLAATTSSWILTCLGFAIAGFGEANIVPILFSAAGRQRHMPPNLALAAATTVGYAGGLIGPASIGYVAQLTTLPIAFVFVAILLAVVGIVGPKFAGSVND